MAPARPADELLRSDAPELRAMPAVALEERMASDERALLAIIGGLDELEQRFRQFEAALATGERSYYRQEDDDEIRRMLVSYLSFRTALLRTVWFYQRQDELAGERERLRALLLHYTAAATAYDYAARFCSRSSERRRRSRSSTKPSAHGICPRAPTMPSAPTSRTWRIAAGSRMAGVITRDAAQWAAHGLLAAEPHATFHARDYRARRRQNTARLLGAAHSLQAADAMADVGKFTRGGCYRASSAVSTLIGDTKIREPRHGQALIHARAAGGAAAETAAG